jgi:hypothetical protein
MWVGQHQSKAANCSSWRWIARTNVDAVMMKKKP